MKLLSSLLLVVAFNSLMAFSCSKSDTPVSGGSVNTSATWHVTLSWDRVDETTNFSGYTFTFNAGGTATATKGSSTVPGTWSESSTKMVISFGSDPVLSALNKNWLKENITDAFIALKDDNPASDQKLQFSK